MASYLFRLLVKQENSQKRAYHPVQAAGFTLGTSASSGRVISLISVAPLSLMIEATSSACDRRLTYIASSRVPAAPRRSYSLACFCSTPRPIPCIKAPDPNPAAIAARPRRLPTRPQAMATCRSSARLYRAISVVRSSIINEASRPRGIRPWPPIGPRPPPKPSVSVSQLLSRPPEHLE